jgi:hypothetical protein
VIGTLTEDLGLTAWYQPLNDITSSQARSAAPRRSGVRPPCCTT